MDGVHPGYWILASHGPDEAWPAWDHGRQGRHHLSFVASLYCYLPLGSEDVCARELALDLAKEVFACPVRWSVTTPGRQARFAASPQRNGMGFGSLQLHFTTAAGGSEELAREATCVAYCESLFWGIFHFLNGSRLPLVCFVLWPDWGHAPKLSRGAFILSRSPMSPTNLPAMEIKKILSRLGWFGDTSDRYNEHNVCPGESAIQCIDSLLHRQEEYRDRLSHLFRALCRAGHSEVCQITGDMVQAAIELRNALVAIVNLIEERIGTAAAPYGKSSIAARAAKTLLGPKHDVVAVRRQRMEDLMKHARGELKVFCCCLPLLVSRIRLHDPLKWQEVKFAVDNATDRLEKVALVREFLSLSPEDLGNSYMRTRVLSLAFRQTDKCLDGLLEDIQAITRMIGVERGVQHGRGGCLVVERQMQEMEKKWSDEFASETPDSCSDWSNGSWSSDSELC